MGEFLLSGMLLGLAAGFSPGPLLVLVITETLQHNLAAGCRTALAPLVTDLPIVLGAFFMLQSLAHFEAVLGGVSLLGALFVLRLGWGSLRCQGLTWSPASLRPQSLRKGVLVNFLSPHPYLFWLSVGGPLVVRGLEVSPWAAVLFISGFYVCLVGAKLLLAIIASRSRSFLTGPAYLFTMRLLGALLILFALRLVYDGLHLFGLV